MIKAFICGSDGIEGWYGKVICDGRTHYVRQEREASFNFNTRAAAVAATKRMVSILSEQTGQKLWTKAA